MNRREEIRSDAMRLNPAKRGFTLVEVLVAMVLALVVGGMMSGLLSLGWRLGEQVVERAAARQAAEQWMGRLEADFASQVSHAEWGLAGDAGHLVLLRPVRAGGGGLAQVTYASGGASAGVWRRETQLAWPEMGQERERRTTESHVGSLSLTFAYAAAAASDPVWVDQWRSPTNAPAVLRVRMNLEPSGIVIERWMRFPPGPPGFEYGTE